MNLYQRLCTLSKLKLRSVSIDASILEAKKLSNQNIAKQRQEFDQRLRAKTSKPKFEVLFSRDQTKTERVKSLSTYERRITEKIKAITDPKLWLNMEAIKLDRFRLPIKTLNLPKYEAVDMKNPKIEYSPIGYGYEPVIDLVSLTQEFQKLIETKHKKGPESKEQKREYNRIQKARRREEIKQMEYMQEKAKDLEIMGVTKGKNSDVKGCKLLPLSIPNFDEKVIKFHVPESIIDSMVARIDQVESLPLTHTQDIQKPENAQKCLTTYELIHYFQDIEECKKQLIESMQKTDKIRNWNRDFWNSELFDKKTNTIISVRNLYNRKTPKLACLDIEGNTFFV